MMSALGDLQPCMITFCLRTVEQKRLDPMEGLSNLPADQALSAQP